MSHTPKPTKTTSERPTLSQEDVRTYFARAVAIVSGFAGEGMQIEGEEDPEDFIFELAKRIGVDEEDYCVNALVRQIRKIR